MLSSTPYLAAPSQTGPAWLEWLIGPLHRGRRNVLCGQEPRRLFERLAQLDGQYPFEMSIHAIVSIQAAALELEELSDRSETE